MYFEEHEDIIIKYKVTIDEETLKKLRAEIIDKCSSVIHYSFKDTLEIIREYQYDKDRIRNYKEQVVGQEKDAFGTQDVYAIEYDYLEFPGIVRYIDALLRGVYEIIPRVFAPIMGDCFGETYVKGPFTEVLIKELSYYPLVQGCIAITEVDRAFKNELNEQSAFWLDSSKPEGERIKA